MKKLLFILLLVGLHSTAFSQDSKLTDEEKKELLAQSPFNNVYPTSILKSSDAYFKAQMGLYKEGAIAEKEAHLVALGTSAATKCQYCIPYHISELKRLGASEDEIKTAVLIAADIMKKATYRILADSALYHVAHALDLDVDIAYFQRGQEVWDVVKPLHFNYEKVIYSNVCICI